MKRTICMTIILISAFAGCGKSISDAQSYEKNNAPVVSITSVTNPDGSIIDLARIVSYATYSVTVEASDPDNDTLSYSFSSANGSFSAPTYSAGGCKVAFRTGSLTGGQEVSLSVSVSDSNGGAAAASYDIGRGKLGPAISVSADKTHMQSSAVVTLAVTANCRGTFIVNPNRDGAIKNAEAAIASFKADSAGARLAYPSAGSESSITLAGPKSSVATKLSLPALSSPPAEYDMIYNVWVIFADALGQADAVCVPIHVDDVAPRILSNSATAASGSVSTSPAIDITFNEDMDQESLKTAVLSVTTAVPGATSGTGTCLDGSYNGTTHTATYLVKGLSRNTAYTATLTGVTDRAGNAIASANTFSFTTTPTCSVAYNANSADSGTVPAAAKNYLNGESVTVKGNTGTLAKTGCTFAGWNTRSDGTGTTYTAGNTFTMSTESVTLYAKWVGIEFKVTAIALDTTSVTLTVSALSSLIYDSVDVSVMAGNVMQSGNDTITVSGLTPSTEYAIVLTAKKGTTAVKKISLCLPTSASGSQSPFLIYTVDDLTNMYTSGINVLMNDIDLGGEPWTPTGNFTGTFYGNGKTISNFTLAPAANRAFFGAITNTGTVTRLSLDISGWTNSAPQTATAVLAASNSGTISKCSVIGGSMTATVQYAGALVGYNQRGTITECYSTCDVTSTDKAVGGLVGFNNGTITDCYATGAVAGTGVSTSNGGVTVVNGSVGGLVGENTSYGRILNCHATGAVTGASDNVGGLVGETTASATEHEEEVTNCYATGNVTGTGSNIGGLVGRNFSYCTIKSSFATGTVTGGTNVGGLVGSNYASITNCFTIRGTVTGSDYAGGLIGQNGTSVAVTNCYSASGTVRTNKSGTNIGGFAGNNNSAATITHCYYDTSTTGWSDSTIGTGLTTNDMVAAIQNNAVWLESIWIKTNIGSKNGGYPYLKDNVPQ